MDSSTPSEEKKTIILKAVRKLFAQKGYAGTTISLVAEQAGVSRGLLHYYFKNKEDMLARVIQDTIEFSIKLANGAFTRSRSSEDIAEIFSSGLRKLLEKDPDFYPTFFEGVIVARQSQVVNIKIITLFAEFRRSLEIGFKDAAERGIISPSIPLFGLSAAVTGLIDGTGLQMVAQPELLYNEEIWSSLKESILTLLNGDS